MPAWRPGFRRRKPVTRETDGGKCPSDAIAGSISFAEYGNSGFHSRPERSVMYLPQRRLGCRQSAAVRNTGRSQPGEIWGHPLAYRLPDRAAPSLQTQSSRRDKPASGLDAKVKKEYSKSRATRPCGSRRSLVNNQNGGLEHLIRHAGTKRVNRLHCNASVRSFSDAFFPL